MKASQVFYESLQIHAFDQKFILLRESLPLCQSMFYVNEARVSATFCIKKAVIDNCFSTWFQSPVFFASNNVSEIAGNWDVPYALYLEGAIM